MYNNLNERDVETLIDGDLRNLGYVDDPKQYDKRNVFKQQPRTEKESKYLGSLRPDYVLYDSSFVPLAIIEAKKPHEDISKAQKQAIEYAKKMKVPIVFVTDGIYTKSHHVKNNKPLYLNGEEVDDLLNQSVLEKFRDDNIYDTQEIKVIKSRQELLSTFKDVNNQLRDAGVPSGLPRIDLFCDILFLKVISELHETGNSIAKRVPNTYLWDNFKGKKGIDLLDFINKQAFDHFKDSYGGEILSRIEILNGKESILENIIESLDNLWLSGTNTDIKGDAFEYFLRSYGGAETDFGEYFTPRHIVKMLVKLLNPQFGEKVYDPFCGTGGMLIESFKHIKRKMPQTDKTIRELKNETIYGGELTTMNRIAKMNMILAGDGHSNIIRQDSYQNKQSGKYDVVITNIPFGSRMKTDYLGQYGYNGKSAELAGVLHCLDALSDSPNARAGIIVPEGIVFNGSKGYTQLRKDLTEKYDLECVVSLPQGVFTDTGVKSNILIVKRKTEIVKRKTEKNYTWYFDLKNDGFSLDKSRVHIKGDSDIDVLLSNAQLDINAQEKLKKIGFSLLHNKQLKKEKYIFLPNIYESQKNISGRKDVHSFKDLLEKDIISAKKGKSITKKSTINGDIPVIAGGQKSPYSHNQHTHIGDIITMSSSGAYSGYIWYHDYPIWASDCSVIFSNDAQILLTKYLYYILKNQQDKIYEKQHGAGQPHVYIRDIYDINILVPNIEQQYKMVLELEKEQQSIQKYKKLIRQTEDKIEAYISKVWQ